MRRSVEGNTCDVLATKLEAEPLVEVLHCRPIPKLRKGTKELRSTRTLDFKPNRETHGDLCLTAHAIVDRYEVPREFLRGNAPDAVRRLSVPRRESWPGTHCATGARSGPMSS